MNKHNTLTRTALTTALVVGLAVLAEPSTSEAFLGIGEPAPSTGLIQPVTFYGRAELSPGVPCSGCLISVEGSTLGGRTDANGYYVIRNVPPGIWTLTLSHPDAPSFGRKSFVCAGGVEQQDHKDAQQCPRVYLTLPGAVSGRVTLPNTSDYDTAVVSIPELGIFVPLEGGGPGYLLTGVGPGWRKVVVRTNAASASLWVYVQPGNVSMGMNVAVPAVSVIGFL